VSHGSVGPKPVNLKMEAAGISEILATLPTVMWCKGPGVESTSTMNHCDSLNSLITLRKYNVYKLQDISD
jgi:hypothetical protein